MPKSKLPRTDLVWSSNLAYVVGLITTDGNLSRDGRHLSIVSTDNQLVETVRMCLSLKNKISERMEGGFSKKSKTYRLQFGNVVMYDWLMRIGLMPKKSLIMGPLKIESEYFADFLRGHLDGDGTIIHYIDKYNTKINPKYVYERLFVFFLSASKKHVEWLQKEIFDLTGLKGSFQSRKNKISPTIMHRIKYSTKEAKKLLNWIYYRRGLPCLERKYAIAKPFLIDLS